jgi:CDP-paratose 2-epimerase
MKVLVTGSAGLVGSAVVAELAPVSELIVGMDGNMRQEFFGKEGNTLSGVESLQMKYGNYLHQHVVMNYHHPTKLGHEFDLVVHCAAQPSHDWANTNVRADFSANAAATMNLMELVRTHCPNAVVVHMSTNKVYGDAINSERFLQAGSRVTPVTPDNKWATHGIAAGEMRIDTSLHSFFGVSKVAADLLVQEYGRQLGIKTVCLRAGCITGAQHRGVELHGFLNYLIKCAYHKRPYTVYGHGGYQVRDNLDARDLARLIRMIGEAHNIVPGSVYNVGGGLDRSISVLEAVQRMPEPMEVAHGPARLGDHKWWVTDNKDLQDAFGWTPEISLNTMIKDIWNECTR